MGRSKLFLTRINSRNNETPKEQINILKIEIGDTIYTITPDFDGFRINKADYNINSISVEPACSNEVIIH